MSRNTRETDETAGIRDMSSFDFNPFEDFEFDTSKLDVELDPNAFDFEPIGLDFEPIGDREALDDGEKQRP